jgi:hypothetical protein
MVRVCNFLANIISREFGCIDFVKKNLAFFDNSGAVWFG